MPAHRLEAQPGMVHLFKYLATVPSEDLQQQGILEWMLQ